ncbi:hypothetical protein PW683_40275 (plasmid) [Streptomyces niveus]
MTFRLSPARFDNRPNNSVIESAVIGAPSGSANRFTSTKSLPGPCGSAIRSITYWS